VLELLASGGDLGLDELPYGVADHQLLVGPLVHGGHCTVRPMATEGELGYFDAIGDEGRAHAVTKPFSDPDRSGMLLELGAVLGLLPAPPADVLDCGCGTGWLAWLLQRCGYRATGIDVAPRAVELAAANPPYTGLDAPRFVVGEVESMRFEAEFDAVLFFDSLHHAVDEEAALRSVHRALRPGGVCITSEPGRGHAEASRHAVDEYGVTERDMPARHIAAVGRRVGFSRTAILPRADKLGDRLYRPADAGEARWKRAIRANPLGRALLMLRTTELQRFDSGIVVLTR
jgi:SAM-dependent methyltransferase